MHVRNELVPQEAVVKPAVPQSQLPPCSVVLFMLGENGHFVMMLLNFKNSQTEIFKKHIPWETLKWQIELKCKFIVVQKIKMHVNFILKVHVFFQHSGKPSFVSGSP